jgi:hypothetical protein
MYDLSHSRWTVRRVKKLWRDQEKELLVPAGPDMDWWEMCQEINTAIQKGELEDIDISDCIWTTIYITEFDVGSNTNSPLYKHLHYQRDYFNNKITRSEILKQIMLSLYEEN